MQGEDLTESSQGQSDMDFTVIHVHGYDGEEQIAKKIGEPPHDWIVHTVAMPFLG